MISIILPSWDDYKYLKPCLESIKKYTVVDYEILIHLNTYDQQLLSLAGQYDPNFTESMRNEGIAYGTNRCAERSKYPYLYFPNSDMIFLPGWDTAFVEAIKTFGSNNIYSSTMIEPYGSNENFIIKDYGKEPETLNIDQLLSDLPSYKNGKYYVKHIVPYLIPRHLFESMDERMWPGWVTDDDVAVAAYTIDSDIKFIRVNDSHIYHFMCKCTHKIGTEVERFVLGSRATQLFNDKWGKIYPNMNTNNYRSFIYSGFKGMSVL